MIGEPPDPDASILTFQATAEDSGARLDSYLANHIADWSRARIQRLIEDGDVLVGGRTAKSSYKLRTDDEVEVELTPAKPSDFSPENIPIEVIFEDEDIIVIDKPAGLVVHPAAGIMSGTLANALAYRFQESRIADPNQLRIADCGLTIDGDCDDLSSKMPHHPIVQGNLASDKSQSAIRNPKSAIPQNSQSEILNPKFPRPGIVHRLDKDTSGLIVVAKNAGALERLADQFHEREVFKSYLALVHGRVAGDSGRIDQPIARDPRNRTRMAVVRGGRPALSLYRVRRRYDRFTLLDVEIKTGRTHQIRVHLQSIKHPVVGDTVYGEGRDNTVANPRIRSRITAIGRQFLHAEKLGFRHPSTGERVNFTSPLPVDLAELIDELEAGNEN